MRRSQNGIPFFDTLLAIISGLMLLLALALVAVNTRTVKPSIRTPGLYAIVATWPGLIDEDVDLYVRDPRYGVVFFANRTAGLLHLEQDDLGWASHTSAVGILRKPPLCVERTILIGVQPGEYTANVHLYRWGTKAPVPVTVTLWRLAGGVPVVSQQVRLRFEGAEATAFRFTVTPTGDIAAINHLPAEFVGATAAALAHSAGTPG